MLFYYAEPKPSKKTSSPVLARVGRNEVNAAEDCVNEFGNFVWAFSKRETTNEVDAQTLTSKIFDDIWKLARHYDPAKCDEITFVSLIAQRALRHA